MSDWITIPAFASGDVVRAATFQDIWTNLFTLKDPMFAIQPTIGDASTTSTFTSASFADIDATNYQLDFESYGNDILFVATIRTRHSASNGQAFFRLMLDGEAVGNTSGLAEWQNTLTQTAGEVMCFTYVWKDVDAGSHTAAVQVATSGATLSIDMYPNTYFCAMEF